MMKICILANDLEKTASLKEVPKGLLPFIFSTDLKAATQLFLMIRPRTQAKSQSNNLSITWKTRH